MTPEEHKSYEEAAKAYLKTLKGIGYQSLYDFAIQTKASYLAGCIHAHKLREDAEREAHNKALDEVLKVVCMPATIFLFESGLAKGIMIEELKKLRK